MSIQTERPLPGGPLAIDLLNTTWASDDGPVDWLQSNDAVRAFCSEYGHAVKRSDLASVRSSLIASRELSRRLLSSASPTVDLLDEVSTVLESARATVVPTEAGPTLNITGDRPHNRLAVEALVNAIELHRDCLLYTSPSPRDRG